MLWFQKSCREICDTFYLFEWLRLFKNSNVSQYAIFIISHRMEELQSQRFPICFSASMQKAQWGLECWRKRYVLATIDATANTSFLHRGRAFPPKRRKPVDKQASGPIHTLGREIKSPVQMGDFELMTYNVYLTNYDVSCKGHLELWSTFIYLEPFL